MGLEAATLISDLVSTNPVAGDPKSQGDDHIRLIKATLIATFPQINSAISATDEEINGIAIAALADASGSITAGVNWGAISGTLRKVTKDFAHLQGVFTASGVGVAAVATMPAGYRPGATVYAPATYIDVSTGIAYAGYVQVTAAGVMSFFSGGATPWPAAVNDLIFVNMLYKLA